MTARPLRLYALAEDSGDHGQDILRTLLWKTLVDLVPGAPVWAPEGDGHAWIDPRTRRELEAMHAAAWKVRRDDRQKQASKRRLVAGLATELLRGEAVTIVFFHHDGDDAWSRHDAGPDAPPGCTLCGQFREFLLEVEQVVRASLDRNPALLDHTPTAADAMARLIAVEPHWSIEAWLLGGSDCAAELCAAHHASAHDGPEADWRIDRRALEERPKPKDACCLGSRHNLALARRFRAEAAYGASPSFTAFVDALHACTALTHALDALAARAASHEP